MSDQQSVKAYYDSFTEYELRSGINLRHYTLFNKIVKSGLKKNHLVLEVGCGIGQITYLLHRFLRSGKLVSADISPVSVQLAQKRVGTSSRMQFFVTDMTDFSYPGKFDFIVLPDVLEHIPIEQHKALFGIFNAHMHEHSKIVIHIPHPKYLEKVRAEEPEKLQIIDQSITAQELINNAYAHNLLLDQYESYSVFNEGNDYAYIVLRQNQMPKYEAYPKRKIILKKSIQRIMRLIKTNF